MLQSRTCRKERVDFGGCFSCELHPLECQPDRAAESSRFATRAFRGSLALCFSNLSSDSRRQIEEATGVS
jgi:hypothetical protein